MVRLVVQNQHIRVTKSGTTDCLDSAKILLRNSPIHSRIFENTWNTKSLVKSDRPCCGRGIPRLDSGHMHKNYKKNMARMWRADLFSKHCSRLHTKTTCLKQANNIKTSFYSYVWWIWSISCDIYLKTTSTEKTLSRLFRISKAKIWRTCRFTFIRLWEPAISLLRQNVVGKNTKQKRKKKD